MFQVDTNLEDCEMMSSGRVLRLKYPKNKQVALKDIRITGKNLVSFCVK
jgi:hypothetical protein